MNELTILTNSITTTDRKDLPKNILKVCTSITPHFYKNKSVEELQVEKISIELLTSGIEQEVLGCMCKLAIKQYPLERARNNRTYFDINYLLTFYEQAFNYYWCDSVQMDKNCKYKGCEFNKYTKILVEQWARDNEIITVKYLVPQNIIDAYAKQGAYVKYYSPKYYESLETLIEDIDFLTTL